ncbi:MAG: BlaI/MecI/CopY family transcriptional regulator [Bacteroidales bacterium]|nr:BlaI/MecI/CopY family transcriptional regulator [Bacteroidales bacterium]MCF8390506.1 BlaI/MecI/CopY family transcriptional regulator [Bacteroidales bacterium]
MKELTKAEEQIMHYIWKLEKAFVKDIVAEFPEPKPAYTTVTTIIRILVKKGFIGYTSYGKVHEYYSLTPKSDYIKGHFKSVLKNYFNNNYSGFASFFTSENDLSIQDLEAIKKIVEEEIATKKK